MRRLALSLLALGAVAVAIPAAEAQTRRRPDGPVVVTTVPLILNVRPRSYLDPGNVVAPGSLNGYSAAWQQRSYIAMPPYFNVAERYGAGVLPDPYTNGPFVGARSVFPPVDFNGLYSYPLR